MGHIAVLSSDRFEGRAPGSAGETLSVRYIADRMRAAGLAPGNPDGRYTQEVPLVGVTSEETARFSSSRGAFAPSIPDELVAASRREAPVVRVKGSELVFVGYGIQAPEFDWDDYKGTDLAGKTLVMLINNPPFKGKAMTYYGRWTYKYEIASAKKAAAVLIIHEDGPAGYPYKVVSGSFGAEQFDIDRADGNKDRVAVEGWLSAPAARRLLALAGRDLDELKASASRRDFRPIALGVRADLTVRNKVRRVRSRNVVGLLPGAEPGFNGEYVVLTAHWDHLGRGPTPAGGPIYSGALDNASGVAMLLCLARDFASRPVRPRRSMLFLSVTAEEKGLLGSEYYAEHPLYPLEKALAEFNVDVINPWGRTRDVTAVGLGLSTLDEDLAAEAAARGRQVMPDPEPEKGHFYRSDHFEFAKKGVPAIDFGGGVDFLDRPAGWGLAKRREYVANDYHRPSDKIKPDWDLAGAVEDMRLLGGAMRRVADEDAYPQWKAGAEFKAVRERMLGAR